MRKAGKQRIKAAMAQWHTWHDQIKPRIDAIKLDGARAYLWEWAYEVRARIEAGELGVCTSALAASVRRDIEAWETGYYKGISANGSRQVA